MARDNSDSQPKSIGFIGLGAMGKPMVMNLAKSLVPSSHIYLNDVVVDVMDEVIKLCTELPITIVKCANAKEVTERSV